MKAEEMCTPSTFKPEGGAAILRKTVGEAEISCLLSSQLHLMDTTGFQELGGDECRGSMCRLQTAAC